MEVILLKDVKGQGKRRGGKGKRRVCQEFPDSQGYAVEATSRARKDCESKTPLCKEKGRPRKKTQKNGRKKFRRRRWSLKLKPVKTASFLAPLPLKDISEALEKQHGIKVDKKK